MLKFKWFIYLSTAGLFCFGIQSAKAQPIAAVATTQIPCVKDLPRPATSIKEWLTQTPPAPGIVRITGVRLNQAQSGLKVVLETANGELLQGLTSVQGDRLIVEVPNAQLQLAEGQSFRQENPAPGIAAIDVSQTAANTVRVTAVGVNGLPEGTIVQSQSGLVLGVTPVAELPEEELVVTAQKTPQNPQTVPISLTVLQRQELEDGQVESIRGIAANTPNFFSRTGGSCLWLPKYSRTGQQ